ncbi:hypothetical protein A4X06_0g1182 [Tilletia controversa]|uniref:PIN domain-like protein n=1 Tax=Tilletia controversa TaxID=13291 RepID=A0A8X7MYV9_9BASI|nr:hypothetical protein A4X06_0g1182 [Tilletia controversa]
MGVQDLWALLQPVARPLKLETLEGQRLAIDSSIWLYHFQNAMRDKEGRTLSNAHILGFLWRILKLLFYGIKPVFVFDGGAPVLKRRTLAQRKTRKEGARETHAKTAEKLLAAQLRAAALNHVAQGGSGGLSAKARGKRRAVDGAAEDEDWVDDIGGSGGGAGTETGPSRGGGIVYLDDLRGSSPVPVAPRRGFEEDSDDDSDIEAVTGKRANGSPSKPAKPTTIRERVEAELKRKAADEEASSDHEESPTKRRKKNIDWHKDQYDLPPLEQPLEVIGSSKAAEKNDIRFATDEELRVLLAQLAPEDLDTSSEAFRSLPFEMQYELVGDARVQSRGTSYKRLQAMLKSAPTAIDFSRAQVTALKTRNQLTQRVFEVTDDIGKANIRVEGISGGKGRVEGARGKEYVLLRNEGAEGGWVLGVRTDGRSAEDAIEVPEEEKTTKWFEDAESSMSKVAADKRRRGSSPTRGQRAENGPSSSSRVGRKPPSVVSISDDEAGHLQLEEAVVDLDSRSRLTPPAHRRTAAEDAALLATPASVASSSVESIQDFEADAYGDLYATPELSNEGPGIHIEEEQESLDDIIYDEKGDPIGAILPGGRVQGFLGDKAEDESDTGFSLVAPPRERKNIFIPKRATEELQPGPSSSSSNRQAFKSSDQPSKTPASSAIFVGLPDSDDESVSSLYMESREREAHRSAAGAARRESERQSEAHQTEEQNVEALTDDFFGADSPAPERSPSASSDKDMDIIEGAASPGAPKTPAVHAHDFAKEVTPAPARSDHEAESMETGPTMAMDVAASPEIMVSAAFPPEKQKVANLPTDELTELVDDTQSEAEVEPDLSKDVPSEEGDKSAPSFEASGEVNPFPAPPAVQGGDKLEDEIDVPSPVGPTEEEEDELQEEEEPQEDDGDEGLSDTERRGLNIQYDEDSPDEGDDSAERVVGPDGLLLPTRGELEAFEAEDADDLGLEGDQDEFVSFLSKTKGRSLREVQEEVEAEVASLKAQHSNTRRSQEDITNQMVREIQLMLRLFGLPYITAPMEAEAQCAELVQRGLVDGIITDDSDVFLFGGTRVFKNMFNQNKVVECYLLSDLDREMGISRQKLVSLAYLLGSDYTEGLPGVGPVTAMEVLAAFFDDKAAELAELEVAAKRRRANGTSVAAPAASSSAVSSFDGQVGLIQFRDWWIKVQMGQESAELPPAVAERADAKQIKRIKRSLRNKVHLSRDWPHPAVLDAYYTPVVDTSDEPFQWGLPDLDSLRMFLGEYLKWSVTKTDQYLLPVIEAQNRRAKSRQTTLDQSGFVGTSGLDIFAGRARPKVKSTRLQEVIERDRRARRIARAGGGGSSGVGKDGALRAGSSVQDAVEILDSADEEEGTAGSTSAGGSTTRRARGRGRGRERGRGRGKARAQSTRPEEDHLTSSGDEEARGAASDEFTESSSDESGNGVASGSGKKGNQKKKKTKDGSKSSKQSAGSKSSRGAAGGRGRGRGRGRGTGLKLADARRMNLDDAPEL